MTPAERLGLIEQLWDSLTNDPQTIPLTSEQADELDRRLDLLEKDPDRTAPWSEVSKRLRSRLA